MKVSVITVTYNSAETLSTTIESVLHQSYPDIEYWIIDGHSRDNTIPIIQRYEDEFHGRLHWISEDDRGLYDAMNKGIDHCSGDIIGILNSDDFYSSNHVIEEMVEQFSNNIDAIFGNVHFIRNGRPDKIVRYYSSRIFRPFLLRFGFMPAHPSFYIKKDVLTKAGGYKLNYEIGADFELMVRLFKKHKIRYKYIPMDFVTMRMGGKSTNGIKSHLILLKENQKACKENGIFTTPLLLSLKYFYKIFEFKWY